MHICWGFGLYDAIISIYNRGMKDFITPFLELLFMLQSSLNSSNNLSGKNRFHYLQKIKKNVYR